MYMQNIKTNAFYQTEDLDRLDTPVEAAFATGWADHAERFGQAACLPKDVGVFAAAPKDQSGADDLLALIRQRQAPVAILQADDIAEPEGMVASNRSAGVQMVLMAPNPTDAPCPYLDLGSEDAPEMLALAELAKPGPFAINTHRLGDFIGLRENGRLVAMVGQRMRFPGWVEISGVSVDPEMRGRGYARGLMVAMMQRITASGATPFLHAYAGNTGAIRLYASLGFRIRSKMHIAMLSEAAA